MMLALSSFCPECHQPRAGTDRASYRVGGVELYSATHRVFVHEHGERREVHLSPQEFGVLETLMRRPGVAFPIVILADRIGTEAEDFDAWLKVVVSQIRKKICGAATIETVWTSKAYRIMSDQHAMA